MHTGFHDDLYPKKRPLPFRHILLFLDVGGKHTHAYMIGNSGTYSEGCVSEREGRKTYGGDGFLRLAVGSNAS